VLTVSTSLDRVPDDFIWDLRQTQGVAFMTRLSTRLLAAFLAQTSGLPHEPIRGRGQVAIVAVFPQVLLQGFHLLRKQNDLLLLQAILLFQQANALLLLLDQLLLQSILFFQQAVLFSQVDQFFFLSHALTLHIFARFDKSLAYRSSYQG
jgi:hypothetical protein